MKKRSGNMPGDVLYDRWDTLLRTRSACLLDDDLETVHDLRVSTRRLRSALQLFSPFCAGRSATRTATAIRRLTRGVGELRNIDEALLFFARECKTDPADASLFNSVLESLHKRRTSESATVRKLLKRLDRDAIRQFIDQLVRRLPVTGPCYHGSGKGISLPGYLSETSISLFTRVDHLMPHAIALDAVETRHRVRIAIKHWRYFLEIVAELYGRDYGVILEQLKEYQTVLGTLNDLAVFSGIAEDHGLGVAERVQFNKVVTDKFDRSYSRFVELAHQQPLGYHFLL